MEEKERLGSCQKVLIGLGEEWKFRREMEDSKKKGRLCEAYQALYELVRDRDYFIITMATDGLIYETPLGSRQETVIPAEAAKEEIFPGEDMDAGMLAKMEQIFPKREIARDTRWERIVAPCGNETWRQCSLACTKDIWEPGEIADDRCPHCGAPLTGNTVEAQPYIEEGYLMQWERYTRWLAQTLNQDTAILELGVGFQNPGVIRFPFEKAAYFNSKAYLVRVNKNFPQIAGELAGRAKGIREDSVAWMIAERRHLW